MTLFQFGNKAKEIIGAKYEAPKSGLEKLVDKYNEKDENNDKTGGFEKDLTLYFSQSITDYRSLEDKINDTYLRINIEEALMVKESFTKNIAKFQFSLTAQSILDHIFDEIITFFKLNVKSMLNNDATDIVINDKILNDLIRKISDEVVTCDLKIKKEQIMGMIYHLAGNCHINWDKSV